MALKHFGNGCVIEFVRNFGFGKKQFTWFLSRPNYDRKGLWNSDTVWVYTTDDFTIYDSYIYDEKMSIENFAKFIRQHAQERYKSMY